MKTLEKRSSKMLGILCAALLAAGMLLAFSGCSSAESGSASSSAATEAQEQTRTFTDSADRTVTIPANVERIAVTGPLAQQVLLTIAPEKLVGLATKISDDQAKYLGSTYADLPVFGQLYGGKGDLNKEAIAEAAPQLIIDVGEAKSTIAEDMDTLQEQLGIPCVFIEASLDSYDSTYITLGELLGVHDKADELAQYCADAYEEVTTLMASIPESERVNAAYLLGDAGTNAIAKGSYQSSVIDMVANNVVVVDNPSSSGTGNEVSLEQIALWNPDFIVFGPNSVFDSVGVDPTWSTITAIKLGNYCEVPSVPYNWLSGPPSVNQILGMQYLPRVCYPDEFDNDLQDVVTTYYKLFYDYDLSDADYVELMANAIPLRMTASW